MPDIWSPELVLARPIHLGVFPRQLRGPRVLPRRCWDCDPLRQDGEGSRRPLLLFSREFHSFDIDTFIKLLQTGTKMNCRSDLSESLVLIVL